MTRNLRFSTLMFVAGVVAVALCAQVAPVRAHMMEQMMDSALGTVNLSVGVMADGKALPAGSYSIRISSAAVTPVVGQSAGAEQWVEFVQDGQVKGRELATVIAAGEAKDVIEGTAPAAGSAKVELLRGGGYLRVWANHGGDHYLIHLLVG